ncbi:MAG: hypothetical protein EP344_11485 [Bacteroidetes bacterium]|nr:MAG: hypothetical protein EP344_11485 [Bacteroidota bacterium]
MKTPPSPQVTAGLTSDSGQPGFEILQDAGNWHFQCNDTHGIPLLFSQKYKSEDSARRGLKTTLNLLKKQRIKILSAENNWQLVVRSGNHQNLASSRKFSAETEANKWLKYMVQVARSKQPVIGPKPAKSSAIPNARTEAAPIPESAFQEYRLVLSDSSGPAVLIRQPGQPAKLTFYARSKFPAGAVLGAMLFRNIGSDVEYRLYQIPCHRITDQTVELQAAVNNLPIGLYQASAELLFTTQEHQNTKVKAFSWMQVL